MGDDVVGFLRVQHEVRHVPVRRAEEDAQAGLGGRRPLKAEDFAKALVGMGG